MGEQSKNKVLTKDEVFERRVRKVIPARFNMISAASDTQQSMEAFSVAKEFELPNPQGKSGGACTAAFLQTLYKDQQQAGDMDWIEFLKKINKKLRKAGYEQIPHLSSSRLIDVKDDMRILPKNCKGNKRALLIGINYVGQEGELTACHTDVLNVKEYLVNALDFDEKDMLILMDDGDHHPPTKEKIMSSFQKIAEYSQPGDVVFVHYAGHGGRVKDRDGDEEDGYDETLIPVDYATAGQIKDDDILEHLVKPMRSGVTVTALMDCCHSGTVLDLPFVFGAEDGKMKVEKGFKLGESTLDNNAANKGEDSCCTIS